MACATFIVELFIFRFFGENPERVPLRQIGVATVRLPTSARVSRTCRALHPIGHNGFGPESHGGIGSAPGTLHTRFESDDSADLHGRACPARPYSRASPRRYEIESTDYFLTPSVRGLLAEASLERGGHLSVHHALRDTNMMGGEPIPLAWW